MADIDGNWDTIVKSPIGDQKSMLTIKSDGGSFTGGFAGPMGTVDIADGTVEGNTIRWKMKMTAPMPMTLDCTAAIDGDALTGKVSAGAFGSFPITGTRVA